MGQSAVKNSRRIFSQASSGGGGTDPALDGRVTNLENNEYKVTYYEIISGTSGSLTVPTGATINAGEFGLSGNAILSKIDGSNKPTFESPKTSGGVIVTASLNESTGAWTVSGTYTDTNVALIYSIKIKAVYYANLTYSRVIETIYIESNYTDSFDYTGSTYTLTVAPSFIYLIRTTSMILDENDVNDVIISGTTLTVVNPSFQSGEKIYIKYKA